MTQEKGKCEIRDGGVWISKETLEQWRDDYYKTAMKMCLNREQSCFVPFYAAKYELVGELLKMFDNIEE